MAIAATLVTCVAEIFAAKRLRLVNPLIYCNMHLLADDRFRRLLLWYNAARDHDQAAVWLGQYGPETFLSGDSPFPLVSGGEVVDEQAPPDEYDQAKIRAEVLRQGAEALFVDRPCLLACSMGEWTWGHWLLDMLPKIVLAESVAPKRFTFAVPGAITEPELNPRYVGSVMDSLAAYDIDAGRLLRIQPGKLYRFNNLFDIIDIQCNGMHPEVVAVMQRMVNVPASPRRKLTAVMRGSGTHRQIVNAGQIDELLTRAEAVRIDPSRASFADQVRAFRESDTIVGDLGSNIAAVIYARPETGIVTLGPSGWNDYFFIPTFQRAEMYHADVRGVSVPRDSGSIALAPYLVDPEHFDEGLRTVVSRNNMALPTAAGRLIARAPGPPMWEVRFGVKGNATPFQKDGFASPEAEWTWSVGKSCVLEIPPFALPAADFWLEIAGIGYTAAPYLVSRPLSVVVNDVLRADFEIDDLTRLHVGVPGVVLSARDGMKIVFHHPVCPSPLDIGAGQDARALGFRFEYLALRAS
jgi:hypothetical protein